MELPSARDNVTGVPGVSEQRQKTVTKAERTKISCGRFRNFMQGSCKIDSGGESKLDLKGFGYKEKRP